MVKNLIKRSSFMSFLLFLVLLENVTSLETSCSLEGIPSDTSQDNRYTMRPISDTLASSEVGWTHPFQGPILRTGGIQSPHYNYLQATYSENDGTRQIYLVRGTDHTKNFTRTFKTRKMERSIRLYCEDDTRVTYHLLIPVQDMTAPKFSQSEYNFTVPYNWPHDTPIIPSEDEFVIVGDNAYEIEENNTFLQFRTFPQNIIRVEPVKLWTEDYPEIFYFRLDIYVDASITLDVGQRLKVGLHVRDEYNEAVALINIIGVRP